MVRDTRVIVQLHSLINKVAVRPGGSPYATVSSENALFCTLQANFTGWAETTAVSAILM